MFGPDKCGATDKVHFILRQKNPKSGETYEHHLKDPPRVKGDKKPHLYRAVIKADNTYAVYIDDKEEAAGPLLEGLEPPLEPPKKIDDKDDVDRPGGIELPYPLPSPSRRRRPHANARRKSSNADVAPPSSVARPAG